MAGAERRVPDEVGRRIIKLQTCSRRQLRATCYKSGSENTIGTSVAHRGDRMGRVKTHPITRDHQADRLKLPVQRVVYMYVTMRAGANVPGSILRLLGLILLRST